MFLLLAGTSEKNLFTKYFIYMKNFKNLAYLVAIAAGMLGCDGALEKTNTRAMVEVERNLEVTTSVDDHLGGSTVTFDQSSTIDASDDGTEVTRFEPSAYLNVVLEKEHIEVSNASEIDITLVGEEVVSETDFSEGVTLGKDVVKKFTFSDGQVATVSYGWRYDKAVIAGNEDYAPHLEIAKVSYSNFAKENTSGNDYTVTLEFTASWASHNASKIETAEVTLKPWYTKSFEEGDVVGEPIWDKNLVWNADGTVTATVTKTTPHTLLEDEVEKWEHTAEVIMGKDMNNSWYVADTGVRYESSVEDAEPSGYDAGVFTVSGTGKKYSFDPYYNMPGGGNLLPTPSFWVKVYSLKIYFDNGEKQFTFDIPVELRFSQSVKYLEERAALYPDDTYLGSDVKEFSYVDTNLNKEVMHHTSYTDLKLHP